MTPHDLFQSAATHHRAGRLAEAEAGYRALLAAAPEHADGLHLLGLVLAQSGRPAEGEPLIRRAVALAPQRPDYQNNFGELLRQLNRLDESDAAFRRAIAPAPQFPEAHYKRGDAAGAAGHYRRALERRPGDWLKRLKLAGLAPVVFDSNAAIDEYRARIAAAVEELIAESPKADLTVLHSSGAEPPMLLAYQG